MLALCYHAVSESWDAALAVTPERLREQVTGFLRRGFTPLPLAEAVRSNTAKVLAVTFDDAYRSVVSLGLPVLAELDVPATVFVPTADVRPGALRSWPGIEEWLGTEHESELIGADWKELRPLTEAGWEIGSHTRTHPHLISLDDETLRLELEESRRECAAAVGAPCLSLAYPFGEADARVAAAARQAGYETAVTLADHIPPLVGGRHDPFMLPRLGVHQQDDAIRLRVKSEMFLRSRRLWNATQGLRNAIRG